MVETQSRQRAAAPARALDVVVDRLAGEVSASRLRQLRMVVGMVDRALAGHWPAGVRRPRTARGLFEPGALGVFWDLAASGVLRAREVGGEQGLVVASQRVVRDCLSVLAEEVVPGRAVALPVVGQPEPKGVVARGQMVVLYRRMADMASEAPVEQGSLSLRFEHRVRLLAMVAVVLDTGARSVELQGMVLEDLDVDAGRLVVRRRQQNGAHMGSVVEECVLREGTLVALRRWLRVRAGIVGAMQGGHVASLWVSVFPNWAQPVPGFPLLARGIQRSYASGVRSLNGLMAGRRGWSPLPTTLEQLRRAVPLPQAPAGR
jgi:hypothetical protein